MGGALQVGGAPGLIYVSGWDSADEGAPGLIYVSGRGSVLWRADLPRRYTEQSKWKSALL